MYRKPHDMNRRSVLAAVTLLGIAPGLAWADNSRTPAEIVTALIDAMAQNDADLIAVQFAENAEQAYGQGTRRAGDAFRAWLQSDIIDAKGRIENADLAVEGNTVIATGRYRNDNGYSSDADFLFTIENGKIVQWIVR